MHTLKSIPYKFISFGCLFFIADFLVEQINHNFELGDFKVYYNAAHALLSGQQVYGVLFSLKIGYYKYSPFTAMLFTPLSLLPYHAACLLQFLSISITTLLTCILIAKIFSNTLLLPIKFINLILILSLLSISTHLVREIALGNVNMALLFLTCFALLMIIREKFILSGFILALVIITKPFFIILIIPLIMRRYFKTIISIVTALLLFSLIPAFFFGFQRDVELHKEWFTTLLSHADTYSSPNTIEALIQTYLHSSFLNIQYIILIIFILLYMFFIRYQGNRRKEGFMIEWFVLIAFIPLLFKTDTEHFLMALPLIIYIFINIFAQKNRVITILIILTAMMYAGNSSDLLGKTLSAKMYSYGLLGISDIFWVALTLYIYFRREKMKNRLFP